MIFPAEQHGTPAQHQAGLHTTARRRLDRRQPRGQGAAKRDRRVVALGDDHDRHLERVGQLRARVATRALGGAVPMFGLASSEVIFGGVGTGLYSMLLFVILAVFIGGLMVGRTPEYLGKKIQAREIKLASLGALYTPLAVLVTTGARDRRPSTARPRSSPSGPQGFSESLYAYMSQANNNGSAFAGYTGFVQPNAPGNHGAYGITFADVLGGLTMVTARFIPILLVLAIAGSLAGKKVAPAGLGTMRTDNPTFVVLLIGVIVLVGALTFFPALLLGPIVQSLDHDALLMMQRDLSTSAIAVVLFTARLRARLPARLHRRRAGPLPGQGRRLEDPPRRPGGRLEADRPELPQARARPQRQAEDRRGRQSRARRRPTLLPVAPVADGLRPLRHLLQQPRPQQRRRARPVKAQHRRLSELERPYDPGLTAAGVPVDAVTQSASGVDPHISRPTRASRPTGSPRYATCR